MKRVNPNHDPKHRSRRWDYKSIKKQPHKDNYVRRYDDIKKVYGNWVEREPLENLANDKKLNAFKHLGFWHPMDTLRDKNELCEMWANNSAPWALWKRGEK